MKWILFGALIVVDKLGTVLRLSCCPSLGSNPFTPKVLTPLLVPRRQLGELCERFLGKL